MKLKMKACTIVSLLFLTCCNLPDPAPHTCETKCGIYTTFEITSDQCLEIQRQETISIEEYGRHVTEQSQESVCKSLYRFKINLSNNTDPTTGEFESSEIDPDPVFGKTVGALTSCDTRIFLLGSTQYFFSGLPHEIAHAMQGCWANTGVDLTGYSEATTYEQDHWNWAVTGVDKGFNHAWKRTLKIEVEEL